MRTLFCCIALLMAVSACTDKKQTVQKSPCVGADESPCGPKRYLNKTIG